VWRFRSSVASVAALREPSEVWNGLSVGSDDTAVFVDHAAALSCPHGHALHSFQTRDLDGPPAATYLVQGGRLYLAEATDGRPPAEGSPEVWRIEAAAVVREQRFTLREISAPSALRIYGNCPFCDPVLTGTLEPGCHEEVVQEHAVPVGFRLSFRPGEPLRVERTSGTRDDLELELLDRGVRVLDDDEPLALAHRTLKRRASA
jgi:hypothetical protein